MAIRRGTIIGGVGSPSSGGSTSVRIKRQQTGSYYAGSVSRTVDQRAGDRISVFDYGAVGDGVTDDSAAFNAAINAAIAVGHGMTVYAPSAVYAIGAGIVFPSTSAVPVILEGDGAGTVLLRTGSFSTTGVIDIQQCSDVTLRDITVDGQVTSSTGILYSTIGGDPMYSGLTANSSIWVHGPANRIRFERVTVQHTGGYAILIDTTGGTIQDVRILECLFQNNRPHLFGTSGGDLNYGSWTGGVYVNGDGAVAGAGKVLHDFLVQGCTFRRMTGNCLWSHLYTALNDLHTNFRWVSNHFEDIGLDGMGVNGVSGGSVNGNTIRRNGYITSDDTSPSVPKYLANAYSVGLDTAGLTIGVNYTNNTFISPNGAAMDLDGYAYGTVSGNTARVPWSTDPEYSQDQIAVTGPGGTGNVSYGAQISNTNNDATAGTGVQITGNTFINLSGGAVRLYASRKGVVAGNTVVSPSNPAIVPITLGNIGAGANQRATDNIVTGNQIQYSPGAAAPCVFEDGSISAFTSSEVNWVYDNQIQGNGNAFEFQRDSNTASVTQSVHSTQTHSVVASETVVQREGTGSDSLTRWYGRESTTKTLLMDLHHKLFNSGLSLVGGPLFNISSNGGAGTGSITTGNRTTLAFDDCMASSRFVGDGFLALTDTTFTYPNDAAADLLPASYGLIRYNSASGAFEQSVSVVSGHRVWSALGGTTPPAGSNKQVQYNNGGAFGASAGFTWDNAAGILGLAGYVQASVGFNTTSVATDAIQATLGGVTVKYLIGTVSLTLSATTTGTAGNAAGRMIFDGTYFQVCEDGTNWLRISTGGSGSVAGSDTQIQFNNAGAFGASANLTWVTGTNTLGVGGTVQASTGFNCTGTAYNSIQTTGGVTATSLLVTNMTTIPTIKIDTGSGSYGRIFSAVPRAGGRLDLSANVSFDGANWNLDNTGYPGTAMVWDQGSFSYFLFTAGSNPRSIGQPRWYINTSGNMLINTSADNSSGSVLQVSGTASVTDGYYTNDSGDTPRKILSIAAGDNNLYLDNTWNTNDIYIRPATNRFVFLGSGASGNFVCPNGNGNASLGSASYKWSSLHTNSVVWTSGTQTDIGVVSLTAGSNITITGSAGSYTISATGGGGSYTGGTGVSISGGNVISIGQAVGTGNSVTFATISSDGVVQSTVSGASIAFQTSHSGVYNFQVDGNGNISGAGSCNMTGGFKVSSVTVINSSQQFVGPGVDVGSNGISAGGYNVYGGYVGQTWNVGGSFTIGGIGYTTLIFRGGILVSAS